MTEPRIVSTPTQNELKAQFVRDLRLAAIDGGVVTDLAIGPGSDADLLGTACTNLCMVGVNNVQVAADQANVLDATGADLDRIREGDGLPVVPPAAATGKIVPKISGVTTILNGTQFIYVKNGVRGTVVGNYVNPSNGTEINVTASQTGLKTNLGAGEKVRFVSAPNNVEEEAKVSSSSPLIGGTDVEDDERKRQRILNGRRNRPAGGNWAQLRQQVLDNAGGVQDCYIYPALGGPSSVKVVPVRDFDFGTRSFSRACSTSLLNQVRGILWARNSSAEKIIVQASADQLVNCGLQVSVPDSALSGGNGLGWTDSAPWPALEVADAGSVRVTSASAATNTLIVTAETAVVPSNGQTNIAWWSTADMKFYFALVLGSSGGAGAWTLTLDRPLLDSDGNGPVAGDYISPAAQNLQGYGSKWISLFRGLGPGENTTDVGRLPRAKRHPFIADEDPSDITSIFTAKVSIAYPEITAISFTSSATTPTVPATADDAPNILVPNHFGVYPT